MGKEFYEPKLFMSTNEFPNTMGITATLTEPVDEEILRESVESMRERFPYFYVRAKVEENDLIPVENPLPVTIRNTWEPIFLNSKEANYHLMAFKYDNDRLALEISHSLTDGAGVLPYFKSVLFCYFSRKTGLEFDSTEFRLPGEKIPETEAGNPFQGLDIDGAEAPLYQKPPVTDFYKISEFLCAKRDDWKLFRLKLSESDVMKYCNENDGSPNILMAVLLSRAVRKMDPEGEKPVLAGVAFDHKAQLGNFDNYRMLVDFATIDFPKKNATKDLTEMCTVARGQLMLQAQPENSLFTMKTRKAGFEKMKPLPLQTKIDLIKQFFSRQIASFCVSYANSRSFGPLNPYIRELYLLGDPGATDILCEVACINHNFFLAFSQTFSSEVFYQAFLNELKSTGISFEEMGKESYNLCGVRYDDISEVKL